MPPAAMAGVPGRCPPGALARPRLLCRQAPPMRACARMPRRPGVAGLGMRRRGAGWMRLRAAGTEESAAGSGTGGGMRQTMADLDAILGIEEEAEEEEEVVKDDPAALVVSAPESVQQEAQELAEEVADGEDQRKKVFDSIMKVVESAEKSAEGADDDQGAGEQDVRQKLESLIESIGGPPQYVTQEDVNTMKEKVFGPTVFWVTEVVRGESPQLERSVIFRGNLRGKREKLFPDIVRRFEELFGDKYTVFFIEDTERESRDDNQGPWAAIQVVPSTMAKPQSTPSWVSIVAGALILFTVGTSFQLGLVANIGKLPKETIEWLSRSEGFNPDVLPPGLEAIDALAFSMSSLSITTAVLLLQGAHEIGHRIAASLRKIKLGPSFLLPNTQLGTLGSVTQLKSLARNRTELWDVAFGGPALGGMVSLAALIVGLLLAADPSVDHELLVPVPSGLLQGSLALGSLVKLSLGEQASQAEVFLHPLTVAGWCGLTTTALNLLPVGQLDGGRLMLSAYGTRALNITSLFTYAGLAFGILGSSLALPFGLYVLLCQRDPEPNVQDTFSPTTGARKSVTAAMITLALLILLPLGPLASDVAATSPGGLII
eukprot:evm.model.scf_18.27 EVM.evm.TU.scf_18.27   scf_18:169065-176420(+)